MATTALRYLVEGSREHFPAENLLTVPWELCLSACEQGVLLSSLSQWERHGIIRSSLDFLARPALGNRYTSSEQRIYVKGAASSP